MLHRGVATAELVSSYLEKPGAGEPAEGSHKPSPNLVKRMVEPIGIEPMTSSLQS